MRLEVSTSSIYRKTYARWRAGMMTASENPDTDKCLLQTRKLQNSVRLLASETQSSKTPSSKGASTVHPTGKTSRFASLNRAVLTKGVTTDLLRRPGLAFHGTVGINFTLGCVVPADEALCWRHYDRSTRGVHSSSRLPVADSGSSARPEFWLVRFCKSRIAGTKFWLMTGSTLGEDAVEVRDSSADWTRRCCRRPLRPSHRSVYRRVMVTETHGIEKHLLHGCACRLVWEKGCAKESRKRIAAGCIAFLLKAM